MKRLLVLVLILVLTTFNAANAANKRSLHDKTQRIAACFAVVEKVLCKSDSALAAHDISPKEAVEIDRLVSSVQGLDELQYLSRLFQMSYQEVQEVEYQPLYKRAQRGEYAVCKLIASMPGPDPQNALQAIRKFHSGDATFSLTLDQMLTEQSKLNK